MKRFAHISRSSLPLVAFIAASLRAADLADAIRREDLKAHVVALAADDLEGRRDGEGARKAREYVAAAFEKAGLRPAGEKGFFQEIPDEKDPGRARGQNVLGLLPGTDPALRKEHVIFSAHHDHLGKRGERIFHGADDDATGVAVLIEAARALAGGKVPLKRSVLFISFDLEEGPLAGSRHFVLHPTVPIEDVVLLINMDMLGRDMGDFIEGYLFALGSEHSPVLKKTVAEAAAGIDLKVGLVGTDVIGIRGDYGPFKDRRIPYLFFSTGEHPDYHQPTDTADRILYDKLHKAAKVILRTLAAAASLPERPAFQDPKPDLDEARVLIDVIDQTLRKAPKLGLKTQELAALSLIRFNASEILQRGEIREEEREQIKKLVQQILSIFRKW